MDNGARLIELYKQRHYDSVRAIIRRSMLIASVICCAAGIAVTAATGLQLPMFLYIGALVCMALVLPMMHAGLVTQDTAYMIPMIFFCFVFTPVNWFAFDGLFGSTPYLSVVFVMVILLSQFKRRRNVLLGFYIALLLGLTGYDAATLMRPAETAKIVYSLAGYMATLGLVTYLLNLILNRYDRFSEEVVGSAITDELTGMLSRRAVAQATALSEETYKKSSHDYMVLMLDVDGLKKLNAERGRAFGDGVLQEIAQCIRRNIRSTDYAFRSGDDEFLIILADAAPGSADSIIDRLDKAVKAALEDDYATVSRGCVRRSECGGPGELVDLADRRLAMRKLQDLAGKETG